ncbi:hypothetical protein B0H19DRAFT_1385000 [Mycena capillaripes]|nr:hypothetical protein B0H19DRAFT_1385000 [Mycena capillaripes]
MVCPPSPQAAAEILDSAGEESYAVRVRRRAVVFGRFLAHCMCVYVPLLYPQHRCPDSVEQRGASRRHFASPRARRHPGATVLYATHDNQTEQDNACPLGLAAAAAADRCVPLHFYAIRDHLHHLFHIRGSSRCSIHSNLSCSHLPHRVKFYLNYSSTQCLVHVYSSPYPFNPRRGGRVFMTFESHAIMTPVMLRLAHSPPMQEWVQRGLGGAEGCREGRRSGDITADDQYALDEPQSRYGLIEHLVLPRDRDVVSADGVGAGMGEMQCGSNRHKRRRRACVGAFRRRGRRRGARQRASTYRFRPRESRQLSTPSSISACASLRPCPAPLLFLHAVRLLDAFDLHYIKRIRLWPHPPLVPCDKDEAQPEDEQDLPLLPARSTWSTTASERIPLSLAGVPSVVYAFLHIRLRFLRPCLVPYPPPCRLSCPRPSTLAMPTTAPSSFRLWQSRQSSTPSSTPACASPAPCPPLCRLSCPRSSTFATPTTAPSPFCPRQSRQSSTPSSTPACASPAPCPPLCRLSCPRPSTFATPAAAPLPDRKPSRFRSGTCHVGNGIGL